MKRLATFVSILSFTVILTVFASPLAAQEVVIGLNLPLTGPYAAQGQDQQQGYDLAVEVRNAEKKGVMGIPIRLVTKDSWPTAAEKKEKSWTPAEKARENTLDMIWNQNASMISGGVDSGAAVAQSAECQEQGVVYMANIAHSNAVTGHRTTKAGFTTQSAHRHTFRWFENAWMTANALASYLNKDFGEGTEYFYISSDDDWGFSIEDAMRRVLDLAGADTLGTAIVSAGAADYKDALQQAKDAGAKVLVVNLFGDDMMKALRQAKEMGILGDMTVVAPMIEVHMAKALGPDIIANVLTTTTWYWSLESRFEGSRNFVKRFREKYGRPPGAGAAAAWVAVNQWADAAEKAQDVFADDKIILALEGHKFTELKDEEEWRDWDHQCISSVFILKGKEAKAMANEWDLFDIVASKRGIEVMRSREENPVSLEPLVIEE